ncbi:MAG: HisA/HisF-related TIM barrel protein [Planctomycetota bacterium]
MRLLPVIDVKGGFAVRAIAGRREAYQPFRSALSPDADPLTLAQQTRERWGLNGVYLADLDALEQGGPTADSANVELWHALIRDGFDLLLDPGVRCTEDMTGDLAPAGCRIVIASESIGSLRELRACLRDRRATLGFDLRNGEPVGPAGLAEFVRHRSEPTLLLDLAAVGTGGGVPTLPLCQELRRANPDRALLTGGGVSVPDDLHAAADAGVSELLVASALYDGRLSDDDLRPLLPDAA